MAVIFADDFQQWGNSGNIGSASAEPFLVPEFSSYNVIQPRFQALGFYPAVGMRGTNGGTWAVPSVFYSTTYGGLAIHHNKGTIAPIYNFPGAVGLRKTIRPSGDILYFSACIELVGGTVYQNGTIFQFGSEASPLSAFTNTQAMPGSFLYTVGINGDGFYTFNGVATTVQAFYRPASVKAFIDVVFGPGYMELWINNEMIIRQNRVTLPVTEISIAPTDDRAVLLILRSLMICDNSGGFGQRMGRKIVQTFPVTTTGALESTLNVTGTPTAVQTLGRFATDINTEKDTTMFGSLVSSAPYVKNEFGATRPSSTLKPYTAFVNLQAKRLTPAADGLGLLPFVTIAGTKVYGQITIPTSTWKQLTTEVPIAAAQTFTAVTFGYEHDYKDQNKIWIDDRAKVDVYGDAASGSFVPPGFLGNPIIAAPLPMETATLGAYVFDYAVSTLTQTKTDVTNLSYQQDQ